MAFICNKEMAKKKRGRVKHHRIVEKPIERVGLSRQATFLLVTLGIVILVVAAIALFSAPAAQPAPADTVKAVPGFVGSATTWVKDLIKAPFDALGSNQTDVLKFFFFILVFLIVAVITTKIPLFRGHGFIGTIVAVIISILAIFFIPPSIINMMVNPYSAMGIAMISIIPFILMFLFTQYMLRNSFFKKLAWFFFAAMLLALSLYSAYQQKNLYGWIYGIVSVLAIVMLFAHKWIDRAIWHGNMDFALTAADKRLQQRMALDQLKEQEAAAQGIPGAASP